MNSQSYDAVCALSLHDEDHQEDASGGALDKLKGGVQAVMAAGRLDTQIYGRRWNDLTPEGQRRIAAEKREQRLQKQREQRQREAERVTFGDVAETMRKNSVVGLDELRRRLSHSGTDLSKVDGEMVWSKAWLLTPEASQPDLVPGARYHNRRRSGFVTQEQLLEIGVVYMKLPTTSLDKLNALCDERGYCEMTKDTLTGNAACLNEWYSEKYNTVEYAIFVQSGACFVDVRDENHEFVRVELGEGGAWCFLRVVFPSPPPPHHPRI
eukprot:Rhum_TRINITY_DN13148_c0_g1::Rhum_TRINITY_DN13148_c0_g1_i4::g.57436::m.57436